MAGKRYHCLLVLILIVTISACTSKQEAAQKFYDNGKAFYTEENWDKARIEFLNAIQKKPHNPWAYYYLGKIAQKQNDIPAIYENMTIAIKMEDTITDARITLAELQVYGKQFEEAYESASIALEQEPEHFKAITIQAAAKVGLKDFDAAQALVNQAQNIQPDEPGILSLQAVLHQEAGNIEGAIAALDKAVASDQDKVQFLLMRFNLHETTRNIKGMEHDLRALAQELPQEERFVYALTRLLYADERPEEAETFLKEFITRQPDNYQAKLFLIQSLLALDTPRGEALLKQHIADESDPLPLIFFQIQRYITQNNIDDATTELNKVSENTEYDEKYRLIANAMRAEILFKQSKPEEALKIVDANLKLQSEHEASLLLIASYELKQKLFNQAITRLRTVLKNNPESEKALVLLGLAYTQSGSELLANDAYRQALEVNPGNLEAAIPVIRKFLTNENVERAEQVINSARISAPKDQRLIAFLAQIKLQHKDWQATTKLAQQLIADSQQANNKQDNSSFGYFLLGRVEQGKTNHSEAINLFQQALEIKHTTPNALQALASSYIALSQQEQLFDYLSGFQKQYADYLTAYAFEAQVHRSQGNIELAAASTEKTLKKFPTWIRGYNALANDKRALGQVDAAIDVFQQGIKTNNNNSYLRVLLASLYENEARLELAISEYKSLLETDPKNLIAVNNYANLLLDKTDQQENYALALEIAEPLKKADQVLLKDTYGWALIKNAHYVEGERYLREAADTAGSIPEIHYHLGVALHHLGRNEEAKQRFNRALRNADKRPELQKVIELALAEASQ